MEVIKFTGTIKPHNAKVIVTKDMDVFVSFKVQGPTNSYETNVYDYALMSCVLEKNKAGSIVTISGDNKTTAYMYTGNTSDSSQNKAIANHKVNLISIKYDQNDELCINEYQDEKTILFFKVALMERIVYCCMMMIIIKW